MTCHGTARVAHASRVCAAMERAWYVAAENETVQGIARRLDMTAFDLVNMNTRVYGLTETSKLRAGTRLRVLAKNLRQYRADLQERAAATERERIAREARRAARPAERQRRAQRRNQRNQQQAPAQAQANAAPAPPPPVQPVQGLPVAPVQGMPVAPAPPQQAAAPPLPPAAAVPPPPPVLQQPAAAPPPPPPPPQHQQPVPAAAAALPPVRLSQLEARLSLTAAPSGLMPRVEQLEQTFGVTTAGSVPERLTALEAVADSWGI